METKERLTLAEICKKNSKIRSLIEEASAQRVLNVEGKPIRIFPGDPRWDKLPKDLEYCSGQLFHALARERGQIGLKSLANGVIASNPELAEYREAILAAIWDALPCCQHPVDWRLQPLTGGHYGDYPLPEARPGNVDRKKEAGGFFNILDLLGHKTGGPAPKSVVNMDNWMTLKSFDEPVFLVRTPDDQARLWLNIDGRKKVEDGHFSLWYSRQGVLTVDSIEQSSEELEQDIFVAKKIFAGGRPAVLTFPSEKLISLLTSAGIPTAQINGIPASWEAFLKEVVYVGKAVSPGACDMSEAVLDGWLGEICRTRMSRHAIAYAWPALLTVAGMLVEGKANLFTCLVGGPGTGKGQAIDHALRLLPLPKDVHLPLKSGSAEGLAALIGDIGGASRLFHPDELLHTMEKAQIEGASFASFFNTAFDGPMQNMTMARGRQVTFNCRLSILGGIVTEKFGDGFGGATTGGLYDRFIFGAAPTGYAYKYQPFEGDPAISPGAGYGEEEDPFAAPPAAARPIPVTIDASVYKETSAWLSADPKLGRLVQLAIRVAYIAAAFDGRPILHADDLGPARAFLDYQKAVRGFVAPNSGITTEGVLCQKFITYLAASANGDLSSGEREMFNSTRAYDYGAGLAGRALGALVMNGDVERFRVGRKWYIRLTKD